MSHKIHIKQWDSGDWVEVYLDGEIFMDGHHITRWEMIELLTKVGCEVTTSEVEEADEW